MDDESKEQLLSLALVCAVNLAVILLIRCSRGGFDPVGKCPWRPHTIRPQGHLLPGKGSAHLTSTFSALIRTTKAVRSSVAPPGCR